MDDWIYWLVSRLGWSRRQVNREIRNGERGEMLTSRLIPFIAVSASVCAVAFNALAAPPGMLDPSLQVVDLSDLIAPLPLTANSPTQILWRTQDWEHSS